MLKSLESQRDRHDLATDQQQNVLNTYVPGTLEYFTHILSFNFHKKSLEPIKL